METLMKVVASAIGSLTNAQKVSDTFNSNGDKSISMPTISNYFRYLTESFVIQKCERYDIKGRKYISIIKRLYLDPCGKEAQGESESINNNITDQ